MTKSAVRWWKPVFWTAILVGTLVEAAGTRKAATVVSWPANQSCVAWAAESKMFWFRTEHPIGKNCFIRARVVNNSGVRSVHLDAPIWKFDSGEPKRDADVVQLLQADKQPNISFDGDDMDEDQWRQLLASTHGTMNGKLSIAGVTYPVEFATSVYGRDREAVLDAVANTKLNAFGIKPPRVGGGVIATVSDDISLQVHLRAQDVDGM